MSTTDNRPPSAITGPRQRSGPSWLTNDIPLDSTNTVSGSFRDPGGRVVTRDGQLLRLVFDAARDDYQHLMDSGLYARLVEQRLLVPHEEMPLGGWEPAGVARVLRPQRVPFVSYGSEWCFSQLRDAAATTLRVQREALRLGMSLKDAPAANIQFIDGRPVLIDTLSLVRTPPGPWIAYYQFCRHFLAPLLLVVYRDARLQKLRAVMADGIPLDLASALLPRRSWLRPAALLHVHMHARAERRSSEATPASPRRSAERTAQPALVSRVASRPDLARRRVLVDSLLRAVEGLAWEPPKTQWTAYEREQPTYTSAAWNAKRSLIARVLEDTRPAVVWDFGAATGHLSRLAAEHGAFTVALEADAACVETMYRDVRRSENARLLPLVQDLLQPSVPGGWAGTERMGLVERGPADLLLAVGLIHHLATTGGVPFYTQLEFFGKVARAAVVEFIPPDDPIVQGWSHRFDVSRLNEPEFRAAAEAHFTRVERYPIPESGRMLYHLSNV